MGKYTDHVIEEHTDHLFKIDKYTPKDWFWREQIYIVTLKKNVLPIKLYECWTIDEIERAKARLMEDFISFMLYSEESKYNEKK